MGGLVEQYRYLTRRGADRVRQGRFQDALRDFTEARNLASRSGDPELEYESISNISMVRLELGEPLAAQEGLREIILQSRNERVVMGASYNLAVSLRKRSNHARALVYARKAMEIARKRKELPARAMCHNLLGNIYLGQSHLEEALREYRRALALRRRQNSDVSYSIGILKENIGYCLVLKRQFRRGIAWIEQALALAGQTGDRRCEADCLQDLCYAHLHLDNYGIAARFGRQALDLAIAGGYRDIEKNCYYLMGEIAHLAGDPERRDEYFEKLQKEYPGIPFLRDFLCAVDVSGMINLKG